jgi:hypothetical protein
MKTSYICRRVRGTRIWSNRNCITAACIRSHPTSKPFPAAGMSRILETYSPVKLSVPQFTTAEFSIKNLLHSPVHHDGSEAKATHRIIWELINSEVRNGNINKVITTQNGQNICLNCSISQRIHWEDDSDLRWIVDRSFKLNGFDWKHETRYDYW